MAITLSELVTIYREQTNSFPNYYQTESNQLLQNLNLLVRQKRLGLNIEPLLENYPEIARYLLQLERAIPDLFNPRKKIYLNYPITAKLPLKGQEDYWLQTSVNLAKTQDRYLLLTWSLQEFKLSFSDRVNLWASCRFLNLSPNRLSLVCYTLTDIGNPIRSIHKWDKQQHSNTLKLLKKICTRSLDGEAGETKHSLTRKPLPIQRSIAKEIERIHEFEI
jgi:hypothetical protein